MKKIIALCIITLSFSALADQCAYISKKQATEAAELILSSETVQTYCEPCGDYSPVLLSAKHVEVYDVDYNGLWEVAVDGEPVDLAYTYVEGINISKYIGCESSGVTSILE